MYAPVVPPARLQARIVSHALVSALAAALIWSAPVFADEPPTKPEPQESSWGLGLAVVSTQRAYKETDREVLGVPILSYENEYVNLVGPSLELKVPSTDFSKSHNLKFGLLFNFYRGSGGYETKDSPYLAGMEKRKAGVWGGGKVAWENKVADVKLEWMADVSGNSKGQVFNLNLEHSWMLTQNLTLTPKVGIEWVDSRYVNYYYGVRPSESTAQRPAYVGKATLNGEIGLTGIYQFYEHHSAILDISVKCLGEEIKNSPLVSPSTENSVTLGYLYRF